MAYLVFQGELALYGRRLGVRPAGVTSAPPGGVARHGGELLPDDRAPGRGSPQRGLQTPASVRETLLGGSASVALRPDPWRERRGRVTNRVTPACRHGFVPPGSGCGMSYRAIQVGTGGQGARWCDTFLQPHVEAGRVDVVAAVDGDESAPHERPGTPRRPESACYTDVEDAAKRTRRRLRTVVVPPGPRGGSRRGPSPTTPTSLFGETYRRHARRLRPHRRESRACRREDGRDHEPSI